WTDLSPPIAHSNRVRVVRTARGLVPTERRIARRTKKAHEHRLEARHKDEGPPSLHIENYAGTALIQRGGESLQCAYKPALSTRPAPTWHARHQERRNSIPRRCENPEPPREGRGRSIRVPHAPDTSPVLPTMRASPRAMDVPVLPRRC